MSPDAADSSTALAEVFGALEAVGARYHVGGSHASSFHGLPRQTLDADLVVDLPGYWSVLWPIDCASASTWTRSGCSTPSRRRPAST